MYKRTGPFGPVLPCSLIPVLLSFRKCEDSFAAPSTPKCGAEAGQISKELMELFSLWFTVRFQTVQQHGWSRHTSIRALLENPHPLPPRRYVTPETLSNRKPRDMMSRDAPFCSFSCVRGERRLENHKEPAKQTQLL